MAPILIPGLIILGWLIGILINYLADVLPEIRRIGPDRCPGCQKERSFMDVIFLRRCSKCSQRRSVRVWVVQAMAIAVTLITWLYPHPRLGFWAGLLILVFFGIVAVIDIEHRLILHMESAFGALLGIAVGSWLHGLINTLLGGLAGVLLMAGMYLLGWALAKLFGKMRGRAIEEDALGFGDIMLSGVLGLMLGWPGIVAGVVYTIFIAGAGSLIILAGQLLRKKYEPFAAVAYGPYMLLAAVLLLYWPK